MKRQADQETSAEKLKLLVFETDSFKPYGLCPESGPVRIGRGVDAHVQLRDPTTSRHHATLHFGPLRLEDADSANGTFVEGRRLPPRAPVPIRPGQPFLIGRALIVVHPAGSVDASILERGEAHLEAPRSFPEGALAHDPATVALFALAARVARGHINVLIVGETGAGKELVAETIHRSSARRHKPFIRINCAALPEQLIESELFGHERGSFTGAVTSRPGVIETANEGTLFLDEVGEIAPHVQAKLLRVIESQEVQRLGSARARPIDVRFVSATNRNIAASISAGTFRSDLYFRLNGVCLEVPPLRARAKDVLPLAEAFLAFATKRLGSNARLRLSAASEAVLLAHHWPGNVRELRNVIDRAALLAAGDVIEPFDLGLAAANAPTLAPERPPFEASHLGRTPPTSTTASAVPFQRASKTASHERERQRIVDALNQCCGNQTRAAKMMGIPRRTFVSKLTFFGLPRPRK